jgi:GTP-binding protein EngB required for normal cell division
MILGRTGVGKSTLINYIHGSEVVKTGAGKPITPKGEFNKITVPYPLKPDVALNIFDSWGLEPDKAEKWDAIISAKLSATLLFAEMISGIVYCFSYSEKIVDFEIKMLKKLLNKQYKVIIALTKADFIHDNEELKTIYLDRLAEELAEYRDSYTVVDICAEEIQKFTKSSSILPFGKETLLGAIAHDARDNFFKFAYRQWTDWKNESQEKLRQFRERKIKEIIDFKVGFLDNNEKKVQDIVHTIDNEWSILSNDILTKIKTSTQDAVMLYKEIEAHSGATEDAAEERKKNITFWDVVKKTLFVITLPITVPFNIIDSIGDHIDSVTEYMKEKPNIQKALVDYLNKSIDDIDKKINDAYSELEKMLS